MMLTEDSPLSSGKISLSDASWIGSALYVGNIFGNFLFVFIAKYFSLKVALNLLALPNLVNYSLKTQTVNR